MRRTGYPLYVGTYRKYVALLRGINVGGKNKVNMAQLKAALAAQGFNDVVTYINSGNVIFESDLDAAAVKGVCEETIRATFGLGIACGIFTATELIAALENAPKWWDSDPAGKHNAIFVIAPATAVEVFAAVGEAKEEYERVVAHGNVIFWSAPLATFSRTRWSKIVQHKDAYNVTTIRNANTFRKLVDLVS